MCNVCPFFLTLRQIATIDHVNWLSTNTTIMWEQRVIWYTHVIILAWSDKVRFVKYNVIKSWTLLHKKYGIIVYLSFLRCLMWALPWNQLPNSLLVCYLRPASGWLLCLLDVPLWLKDVIANQSLGGREFTRTLKTVYYRSHTAQGASPTGAAVNKEMGNVL